MWTSIAGIVLGFVNWLLGKQKQQNEFTEAGRAEAQRDNAISARQEIDEAAKARQSVTSSLNAQPDRVREPDANARPWKPGDIG